MKERTVTDSQMKLSKFGIEHIGNGRKIKAGTLLMSFKLTLGKTAFAGKDLFTNEAICALILKDEYDTDEIKEYLYHVLPLIDYTPYAQRAAKGLTLNKDLLPTVEVPFPDKSKRMDIVKKKVALSVEKKELQALLLQNSVKYQDFVETEIIG